MGFGRIKKIIALRQLAMGRLVHRNFLIILAADIILVAFAWYFSHLLRFNFQIPQASFAILTHTLPLLILVKILFFYFFDLYAGMWRYTSLTDLVNIIKASSFGSLVIIMLILFVHGFSGFSRSVFIIDWFLTLILISSFRVSIRMFFWSAAGEGSARSMWRSLFLLFDRENPSNKRLLVIGAGDCGEKIFREIRDNARLGYHVIGFIDDDPRKSNMKIHGKAVIGNTVQIGLVADQFRADELLIAIPSASSKQMRHIVKKCTETGLPFKTVPGMGELIDGRVTVKAIRDVSYRDLLGREPIKLEEERIGEYLKGKRVLVTGAGGSIGSELCRQLCGYDPESIILYERAENALYDIELELKEDFKHIKVIPKLSDILDGHQIERAFGSERPHVVFHAAAYKHVPMLEVQPWDAIINNISGTRNVVELARVSQVERFVFVSTDKAVRPVSVMGASKRISELLVQGQNGCDLSNTRFMTVRFGNVVGSAGSVVPRFKNQIEKGGPVTVTHPGMTRYFMSIPEACQLILQAGSMGDGGEIFVLDMGTPVKIADMARDLIRLSGLEPDEDIKIEYVGLRPGEKLKEELITEGEGVVSTPHEKIMVIRGPVCQVDVVNGKVDELLDLAVRQDSEGIKRKLNEILPEYSSAG